MNFASPAFLIFFILVVLLCRVLNPAFKLHVLLISSLLFLACFSLLSVLFALLLSTFNYYMARYLLKTKRSYSSGVIVNVLAVLLFNFFHGRDPVPHFSQAAFDTTAYLLWVGTSFYGLQHLAYITDVYKKRIMPGNSLYEYTLISIYFPKVVAGPVTLYQQLKPVIARSASYGDLVSGFNRILLGLFKKLVIADRLAPSVASVFDHYDKLPGLTILVSAILFTVQLYFDFSGYCDIAIGCSRMLGIPLPENFNFPLRASSVTEFWRRWHITLISFLTQYVFNPLVFKLRRYRHAGVSAGIVFTFLISSIWHGIGITFILWGACHILYLLIELRTGRVGGNVFLKFSGIIYVLLLVSFSHLFFRSLSEGHALFLLKSLFSTDFFPGGWLAEFFAPLAVGGHQADYFNLGVTILFPLLVLIFEKKIFLNFNNERLQILKTTCLLLAICIFGVFDNGSRFIYMQF